jgi:uncharacterized membrane protein YgcG
MNILKVLTVVLLFFVFPSVTLAQARESFAGMEHIDTYDVAIAIRTDGTIDVHERIAYDFTNLERHGIYRQIPYVKSNDAGKRFAMDFASVAVVDDAQTHYPFVQSTEGDDIRWKIGDPNQTVTGKHAYRIGYTVRGALTYFPGHDELYWNAIGTNWQIPIAVSSVTVTLPSQVARENLHVACYTGPERSAASNCMARIVDARTVNVTAKEALDSYEGLTVVVGFPKGMAAVLEPRELVPFFDTLSGKIVLVLMMIAAVLWYIVAPIWVIRKWWTTGRDPKPALGEAKAWFSPPKNAKLRELTPAETGTLVDERADLRDIYASLIDLARRGYLKIIETKKNIFDLEKTKGWSGDPDVLPFEQELLSGIFQSADRISVKTVDLTKTLEKVKSMLYETLVADKFFPTSPNTLRGWYIALAVVAIVIFNPILFLVALAFGSAMPRKTLFGAEAAAIARALRNFLTSQDKKLAYQARNQMMFEKLLAYAVAFGVEEIWAQRFRDLGLKNPDWYQSSTRGRFNSVIFAHSLGHGMSSSFAASIAAHSSSGHSSGFSGGSSGGGGGGGGGGSW